MRESGRSGALRRLAVGFAVLALCAQQSLATWSIVVVNTKTGEVSCATATCLPGEDLQKAVPVMLPGVGAGAAQSLLDQGAFNRKKIVRGLAVGMTPAEILNELSMSGGHQARQYGVVNLADDPITFTGNNAGGAKGGVSGTVGDLKYAIQGNVLTGANVWLAAETALLTTPGDLSQKVMAAMEAARSFGGDGRCSCLTGGPQSCGSPPPSFTKSAHVGTVLVARIGDGPGNCNGNQGCANGDYWLELNYIGQVGDPDPVFELQAMYDVWRAAQIGRPDQVHSTVTKGAEALPANGASSTQVRIQLADIDGTPITQGGAQVTVQSLFVTTVTTPGAVIDHGDGSYTIPFTAGTATGQDLWRITVDDGIEPVVLQPDVSLRVDPVSDLHVGWDAVSAGAGAEVPFRLDLGSQAAGQMYMILASGSGTTPGTPFQGIVVPLNLDRWFAVSLNAPILPYFTNTHGTLDAGGGARASFAPPPGLLDPLIGGRLDWAAVVLGSSPSVTTGVGFDVLP